jgi:hypothetical protein
MIMSRETTKQVGKSKREKHEEDMTIKLPKAKDRNILATFQERKQIMKDPRTKRSKDFKKSWKAEDHG